MTGQAVEALTAGQIPTLLATPANAQEAAHLLKRDRTHDRAAGLSAIRRPV